jgi:hypothetical protein
VETIYDWVTLIIFAGLIVLFLQRSMGEGEPRDSIWQYLGASVGCMIANQLGNKALDEGNVLYHAAAVLAIAGILGYVFYYLRPFDRPEA